MYIIYLCFGKKIPANRQYRPCRTYVWVQISFGRMTYQGSRYRAFKIMMSTMKEVLATMKEFVRIFQPWWENGTTMMEIWYFSNEGTSIFSCLIALHLSVQYYELHKWIVSRSMKLKKERVRLLRGRSSLHRYVVQVRWLRWRAYPHSNDFSNRPFSVSLEVHFLAPPPPPL